MEKDKKTKLRTQQFKGDIKIQRRGDSANPEILESLSADLTTPEDLIFLHANQPVNPELGTVDGQVILADIDLLGAPDERGDIQRLIVGVLSDPEAEFLVNAKHRKGGINLHAKEGDYFIGVGTKGGGLEAIGIIPNDTDMEILGPNTNIPSERYGVVSSLHNPRIHLPPIRSEHELIIATTDEGLAIKLYPKQGALPVRVKTRAYPEHRTVVEEAEINQAPDRDTQKASRTVLNLFHRKN